MTKKTSNYRLAVEKLREKHADKLDTIFTDMYNIAHSVDSNGGYVSVEDKDRVNAAKVCVSLLGVPKPPTAAKEPDGGGEAKEDKPTLSAGHQKVLDDILGSA